MNLVFAPASDAMAAAVQQIVQSALQQWLGDVIQVEAVSAEQQDATLSVTVVYTLRKDGQRRVATLAREI
jgi:phage baseplate assembly protein W